MEYTKCLVQLDEVLNYLSVENLEKIPYDIRDSIKIYKDKEYIWKYDERKALKEQNLDRKTIAMLSYLNMEYLLNNEQKEYIKKNHRINERRLEEVKQKKYNSDIFFNDILSSTTHEKSLTENVAMIEYKESILKKIIKRIKKIFMKSDNRK